MSDMWRSRSPPVPLDFDTILDGTFILRDDATSNNMEPNSGDAGGGVDQDRTTIKVGDGAISRPNGTGANSTGLKDQRALTLRDNLLLFVERCVCISSDLISCPSNESVQVQTV